MLKAVAILLVCIYAAVCLMDLARHLFAKDATNETRAGSVTGFVLLAIFVGVVIGAIIT